MHHSSGYKIKNINIFYENSKLMKNVSSQIDQSICANNVLFMYVYCKQYCRRLVNIYLYRVIIRAKGGAF